MDEQALLQKELSRRIERINSGLPGAATAHEEQARSNQPAGDLRAIAVVRDLDLPAFVTGTLEFASRVPSHLRDPWYRSFTKTLFFAGNPSDLEAQFRLDHVAPGGQIAWIGPVEAAAHEGLRRMLRLFQAPEGAALLPSTVAVNVHGADPPDELRSLYVATGEVSIEDYLVHLNHTLCEASLSGLLGARESLRILHVEGIGAEAIDSVDHAYARVGQDSRDDRRLRLFALLSARGANVEVMDAIA